MEQRTVGTVLMVAATKWISTARLAMALAAVGCRVEMVGLRRHPAMSTGAVSRRYAYRAMKPIPNLRRALRESQPDLLVVADEFGAMLIDELLVRLRRRATRSAEARVDLAQLEALITRSFGNLQGFHRMSSRMNMLREAQAAGVSVPATVPILHEGDLEAIKQQLDGPWILKADATWGGWGVREVQKHDELRPVWRRLHRAMSVPRSVKRGWISGEWGHLRHRLKRQSRPVVAQRRVKGREFSTMATAVNGTLAAAACLEIVTPGERHGPSSVVRVLDDAPMTRAMAAVIKHLGLSGFCGFDFIVEDGTGELLLLEVNARPTQLTHLPMGPGRDLPAAVVRELLGAERTPDRAAEPSTDLIALFPQEVRRDPHSEVARRAFHDVPWDAPALIRHCAEMLPGKVLPDWLRADSRLHGHQVH